MRFPTVSNLEPLISLCSQVDLDKGSEREMSPSIFFSPFVFQGLNIFDSLQYSQPGIWWQSNNSFGETGLSCQDLCGAEINVRSKGDKGVYVWEQYSVMYSARV